jgi:hypothetical protein
MRVTQIRVLGGAMSRLPVDAIGVGFAKRKWVRPAKCSSALARLAPLDAGLGERRLFREGLGSTALDRAAQVAGPGSV